MEFNDNLFNYDELGLFFRENYVINDYITVSQPSVGEIMEFGEKKYYSMASTLCAVPSDMKCMLWDMGIDWNNMPEFELFCMITKLFDSDKTKILLGDLNLSKFEPIKDPENGMLILRNIENGNIIDRLIYHRMIGYIRKMHGFLSKNMKVAGEMAIAAVLERDRLKARINKDKPYSSGLKNLISAMLTYPGFKYKSYELKECGIYEFMDSVRRSQMFVASSALMSGMYSGMIDTSKINKKELNWMRDFDE